MTKQKPINARSAGRLFELMLVEHNLVPELMAGYYDKSDVVELLNKLLPPLSTDLVRPHEADAGGTRNCQPEAPTSKAEKIEEAPPPVGSVLDLDAEFDALENDPDPVVPASGPEVTVSSWTEEGNFSADEVSKGIKNKTLPEAVRRDGIWYFVRKPNTSDVQRWQNSVARFR